MQFIKIENKLLKGWALQHHKRTSSSSSSSSCCLLKQWQTAL